MKFTKQLPGLLCLIAFATAGLRAQVSSFDRQPVSTVSVLGGAADFTFQFRVSQSFATLGVVVSKGGSVATSRFSLVTQRVATESSAGFPTVGFFTLRISNITSADVGTYTFEATVNGSGVAFGVSQPVTLSLGTPTAPQITTQPISAVVSLGGSTTLSVVATGVPAPTYQWKKNGAAISGGIDSSYAISVLGFDAAGTYQVVATNPSGTVTSSAVDVFIGTGQAPTFFRQPTNVAVALGGTASFTSGVTATTFPSPTYQWYRNGAALVGATGQDLSVTNVGVSNGGAYTVVATNLLGTATSTAATLTILPAIVSQPLNLTAGVGSAATFTVVADGSGPLSYRWSRSFPDTLGANASGGTSSTLTIANLSSSDVGGYFVVVTNNGGSVTSSVATLAVILPPSITSQPLSQTVVAGSAVTLAVVAQNASGATYQWKRDGVAIGGATGTTLAIPAALPADAATYSVTITNSAGSVTSQPATISLGAPTAPQITTQPISAVVSLGGTTTLVVVVTGVPTPTHQWRKGGVAISGATDSRYTITFAGFDAAGTYQVIATNPSGSATSNAAEVSVGIASAPRIFSQPASVAVKFGDTANFSATATGFPDAKYQWYRNAAALVGATGQNLSVTNVGVSNGGAYTVVATNLLGTATSTAATLTILPTIVSQPLNLTANAGTAATFTVVVDGSGPISYRWSRSFPNSLGANASGGTSPTLTIANVSSSDVGGYFVTVTNLADSVTSSVATLAVILPPSITTHPVSQTAFVGARLSLSVVAQNSSGAVYQWKKDGSSIPGATSSALVIPSLVVSDAATYSVTVTNSAGSASSNGAVLSVVMPNSARLINLSILTSLSGEEVFSMGFVVGGTESSGTKPLLVRAAGPSLTPLGVSDAHSDPSLEFFAGASKVAENDNWGGSSATSSAFAQVGAFAYASPDSKDAAIFYPSVGRGDNSVRVGGAAGASGAVLVELYDATATFGLTTPRLINVSVLKNIGTGLTVGFVIGGSGTMRVLVRAIGPTLTGFGVTGSLSDPRLSLFNASGRILGGNDNWNSADASTMAAVGAFALPLFSSDAALVAPLAPGNYTVQVTGAGGATGVALVEVYEVP